MTRTYCNVALTLSLIRGNFRAFPYAFELCKHQSMGHKLGEIYLKHAMSLEDEGKQFSKQFSTTSTTSNRGTNLSQCCCETAHNDVCNLHVVSVLK